MIKALGLFAVFLCCSGLGFLKAAQIKKRSRVLKEFLTGVNELTHFVRYSKTEVAEFIPRCFANDLVYFLNSKLYFKSDGLTDDDTAFLTEFFENFGKLNSNEEADRCTLYLELLEKRYDTASNETRRLFKLYNTLGILSGLFFCIFLL